MKVGPSFESITFHLTNTRVIIHLQPNRDKIKKVIYKYINDINMWR